MDIEILGCQASIVLKEVAAEEQWPKKVAVGHQGEALIVFNRAFFF